MQQAPFSGTPLYERCRPFDPKDGAIRIFAPISYSAVRQTQVVPIVHIEALSLAGWFPICWQIKANEPLLVVLRTLWNDGSHQPFGSPNHPSSLPLALRAYPFVVGASDENSESDQYMLDDTIPDEPSDVGAPILTPAGIMAPGTKLKFQAVSAFDHAYPLTRQMTEELRSSDLFEPWPLDFELSGKTLSVKDLFIVRRTEFTSPALFRFVEKFGPPAANLLGAHRISLFRAGVLVQAAGSNAPQSLADQSTANAK